MMKKLISAILLLILLSACAAEFPQTGETYKLFYASSDDAAEIVSAETTLTATNNKDAAIELFSKLALPENKAHASLIPKSIQLLDVSFDNGSCNLTLSAPYGNLSPYSRVAVNFALVNTMSALPDVKQVSITSNSVTTTFTADEFLSSAPPAYYDSYTINLRYVTPDMTEMVTVTKTIVHPEEIALEAYVTELLAANPDSPELRTPFPDGTTINGVYLDGATCVLDLSPEFVKSAPHTIEAETAILTAVVDTLTELPGINRVKFLINGKNGYGYVFCDLSFPIEHSSK